MNINKVQEKDTAFVTRLTRRVPLVEQELLTFPEHLSSPPVFSGVRITRSLVLYVCFVYRCLPFCTFSFGHCVVCSSSIYGFWLSFWYLQTLLTTAILTQLYVRVGMLPTWRKHLHSRTNEQKIRLTFPVSLYWSKPGEWVVMYMSLCAMRIYFIFVFYF